MKTNIKDYVSDIEGLISNARSDCSAQDFIEMAQKIVELLQEEIEEAQDEINDDVEKLVDSFGGKDCSMRELKGE